MVGLRLAWCLEVWKVSWVLHRFDKYEKKTKYWVEEDMEFEWEKSDSKSKEEGQAFQVEADEPEDMPKGNTMMQADLALAGEGNFRLNSYNMFELCM